MKNRLYIVLLLVGCMVIHTVSAQETKSAKQQYAFIMVINKESTKLYYSPVFLSRLINGENRYVIYPKKKKPTRKKLPMKIML